MKRTPKQTKTSRAGARHSAPSSILHPPSSEPACPSCHQPFAAHLGLIGTCRELAVTRRLLAEARAEIEVLRTLKVLVGVAILGPGQTWNVRSIVRELAKIARTRRENEIFKTRGQEMLAARNRRTARPAQAKAAHP